MAELLGAVVVATALVALVVRDLLVVHGTVVRTLEADEPEVVDDVAAWGDGPLSDPTRAAP